MTLVRCMNMASFLPSCYKVNVEPKQTGILVVTEAFSTTTTTEKVPYSQLTVKLLCTVKENIQSTLIL